MTDCPYIGLRSFTDKESSLFFGREEQIDSLLDKLKQTHFIAVIGISGCGKSSIVNAGIIERAHRGDLPGAGVNWRIVKMRPSDQPFYNLASTLLENKIVEHDTLQVLNKKLSKDTEILPFLEEYLKESSKSLQEIHTICLQEKTNLLLIIDQFEELFRFGKNNREKAIAFTDLLLESSQHPHIYIVITMRSEFITDCFVRVFLI